MRRLETITKLFLKERLGSGRIESGISLTGVNPNPRLRKYAYWIYHYNIPYDSTVDVFYKDEHRLSFKQAMDLREFLQKNRIPYAIVNRSYCRLSTKIWDYGRLKKEYPDIEFAVSLDTDADEEYQGHK